MTTIRLNQYIRNEVQKELLRSVYQPKLQAMFERVEALHKEIHAAVYTPELIKKAEAFYAVCNKAGFQEQTMHVDILDIQVNGQWRQIAYLKSSDVAMSLGIISYSERLLARVTKLPDPCNGTLKVLESDPLGQKVMQLFDDDEALREDMAKQSTQLDATLDKFKSLKQVAEHWPEVLPIVEKHAGKRHEPENALVAMSFEELNDFYKLPPEPVEELAEAA